MISELGKRERTTVSVVIPAKVAPIVSRMDLPLSTNAGYFDVILGSDLRRNDGGHRAKLMLMSGGIQ